MMTNFHLNTTVVAIFPNVCLWRRSLCSDFVLTLKNRIEPPSYARTACVVAIWLSFLFDSFVKIWATCVIFLGKWFTVPPWQKISRTPMFKTKNFLLMHHGKVVKEVFGTTTSSTKVVKISIFQTFSLFLPFNGRTGDREEMKFYTVEVNYSRW